MNSAEDPLKDDDELKSLTKKVSNECQICQVYRKVPLTNGNHFSRMCCNGFKVGNILLHLVKHATRLSSSKIIKSKEPKEIIDNIFKIWIQIYQKV